MPLALAPSRGEFDLDLGAEGAGDFFECRQRHAIVIFPVQARDVGLLHPRPPRELGLGPALLQPGSDQTLRENLALVPGLTDGKHFAQVLTRSRQGLVNDVL